MRTVLLLALSLLLAACGDSKKDHATPAATADAEGGGIVTVYALDDPGLALIGPDYADGKGYTGGARFWRDPWPVCHLGPAEYGCSTLTDCDLPDDGEVEDAPAGNVTLGSLTFSPPEYEVIGPGTPWNEGESLELSVEGDDSGAPAMQGDLLSPSFVTLVEPAYGALERAGTSDLRIVWSGDGYGDVLLSVGSLDSFDFHCRWPSADGSGVIPGELLDALEPSSDGTSHTANLHALSETEIASGGFTVSAAIMATRSESAFLIDVP